MADQIIDACCLINLYASGRIEGIIPACGGEFHVTEQVQRESLSIRQVDPADESLLVSVPLNLLPEIASGLIKECRLESQEEIESYVDFATQVDDGEASSLAIAKSRNWTIATDDRKAIRLAAESGIDFITTPELIRRWATTGAVSDDEITQAILAIDCFAKFRPRRGDPHLQWWLDNLTKMKET